MDKWQALNAFWNSFGIPAYDEQTEFTEGDMPGFPHITYQSMGGVMDQVLPLSASIWYKSTSWAGISKKTDEILKAIQNIKKPIPLSDGGYLWIHLSNSTPFAQRIDSGSEDENIKRMYLVIEAACLTAS